MTVGHLELIKQVQIGPAVKFQQKNIMSSQQFSLRFFVKSFCRKIYGWQRSVVIHTVVT